MTARAPTRTSKTVHPGDVVKIDHIEASYERGLSADIDGFKRFSVAANGQRYQIVAASKDQVLGQMFVDLRAPVLDYVVLQVDDGERKCLYPGGGSSSVTPVRR
jgi:hypothetical protein